MYSLWHHQDESVIVLSSKYKYVNLKTHRASHTVYQNLAIILWQFNYGKSSFIVFIPEHFLPRREFKIAGNFPPKYSLKLRRIAPLINEEIYKYKFSFRNIRIADVMVTQKCFHDVPNA